MEKIIESNKIDFTKNLTSVYKPTLTDQVIFLPIRHHSPICSYHIKNIIDEYKPEVILIEGPDNLNDYKGNLFNPGSSMPLAFYTVYKEDIKNDDGSKEKIRESVYYPFADFSPEFVALNLGFEKSIETKFIDLPYSIFKRYAQNYENVLNDTYIQYSDYINLLCEKLNLRDFSEFWEKYFELNSFDGGSLKFIESMYSFCYYTRMTYSSNQLKADGTIQRELFMINNIYENMQKYKRILVITGGFHTPSLFSYNYKSKLDFKITNTGEIENYIVPFSYDSIDERSGYRSGITFPQYREHLLSLLHKEKDPFYENTLYFLHKFHNRLQIVKESGTIVNKIESLRVMDQLKQLRGKKGIGLYEMIDGVLSSYGKVEFLEVLQSLNHVLTGDKIGIYSDDNSPLLKDFIEKLMELLTMNQTKPEKFLYPNKSDKDKSFSLFFHKLNFLDVNFAKLSAANTNSYNNSNQGGDTSSEDNQYQSEEWQLNMTISDGYFMDYSVGDKIKHEERLKELTDRHDKITREEKDKHKKYIDEKKEKLNDLNEEKKTKLKSLTDEEKQNYDKLIKEEKENFNKIQDEENQRYDKFVEEENQRFEKSVNEENFRYERLTEERNKKYANLSKDEKEKYEKKLKFLNRFRVNTQIYVKLVEASVYGSTIDECCQNKFEAKWKASTSFSEACELFVLFLKLEILPDASDYANQLEIILEKDNSINNLTSGFEMLYQHLKVYEVPSLTYKFDEIYEKTFAKIVKLLHFVDIVAEEEEEGFLKSLKKLYTAVLDDAEKKTEIIYIFENLYDKLNKSFEVYGGISGMLYSLNKVTGETILSTFNSIVLGMNAGINMAKYLKGLFTTARDLFVLDSTFLAEINNLFLKLDEMEFLEILPLLRLAFTFFPPYELSQIAQNVANSLGTDINDIETRAKVDNEQEVMIGKILNNLAKEYLEKYKLLEL